MDQPTVASGKLEYLPEQSRAEQSARACFMHALSPELPGQANRTARSPFALTR